MSDTLTPGLTSPGVSPGSAVVPIVRVAVLAGGDDGGRLVDMALPTELPLREILPAVRRMALPAGDDADAPVQLSLAPVGGAP
ncbi:MAG: type secretion integral rane protein EccD, partial [Mycobacterium sp.]|nr:type secretion integral rane protein EccD [Mycobacterium sp.]